jgi:hypothetical protein
MLGVDANIFMKNTPNRRADTQLLRGLIESYGLDGGYHSPKNCIPGVEVGD